MSDVLTRILETKAEEIQAGKNRQSVQELRLRCQQAEPTRGFRQALAERIGQQQPAVIAEIKKASPSKGVIRKDFNVPELATSYATGGATCLSVLTDKTYFQGDDEYLAQARAATELPLLRKEFIIDPWQVYQSRALGADAILLIVAALSDPQLFELTELAQRLGLDVLMEVHDEAELHRALHTPAQLIGINNRNLRTFVTRLETTLDLLPQIPSDRLVISESGLHSPKDIQRLRQAGVHGFLIGEAFMRRGNPGQALQKMIYC